MCSFVIKADSSKKSAAGILNTGEECPLEINLNHRPVDLRGEKEVVLRDSDSREPQT